MRRRRAQTSYTSRAMEEGTGVERRELNLKLAIANKQVSSAQMLFWAAASWVVVHGTIIVWMQHGSGGFLTMPSWLYQSLMACVLAALGLMITGAYRVRHRPVPWTILIAFVATAASVRELASLLSSGVEVEGILGVVSIATAVVWTISALGLWALLRPAVDLQRLYDEHPKIKDAVLGGRRSV